MDPSAPAASPIIAPGLTAARGAWCGVVGGLGAGAIDALWSWRGAAQFAAGFGARLRFLGFCACSYALIGAVVGALAAVTAIVLLRGTRLGELARFAIASHHDRRRRDPGEAVVGLALVLVGVPALVIAAAITHKLALPVLARRNPGLVVWVIMLDTLGALGAAAVVTFVLARQLEVPLAAMARRPRGRWLASVAAAPTAALTLLGLVAGVVVVQQWETVRLLPVRPAAAALGIAALAVAAIPAVLRGQRAVAGSGRRRPWRRAAVALGAALVGVVGMLACGASPATIKAATAYSGLGGSIATLVRRAVDRDHDGYSGLLGGGDCDDGDARVHPGAAEVPGDGVDQNCVGGDVPAGASPRSPELRLVALPAGVPADANILLLTIDTLRADHLGSYGYPRATSPALDRVAAEGTVFEHAWAHAPSTRYSMPAILTGRLPLDVFYDPSVEGWPGLAPRATTIAEVLGPLGLVTGAITNYWYFDPIRGMNQGFDEYDNANAALHTAVPGAGPAETRGTSSREQTDKALAFVERHAAQRWFLWVHYYDPHYEYERHPGSASFGDQRVDLYDGEIRFTDDQIGRLLDELRKRGLYDKTIIAVTGDHGEGFGEHGVELHGYHLYAAQTKVPLIVRVPGLPARRSLTPVGHTDLLPTLANLAGATATTATLGEAMGQSLVDLLAGAPDRERTIWQQLSYEGNHEMRGAADQRCHVLYNVSPATSWESYRKDHDPHERQDLAEGDECAPTRRALARWYDDASVPAGAAAALLSARPALATTIDVDLGPMRLLAVTGPSQAHPGETIELEWTFEARGSLPAGWKVFVHVEGNGRFSGDHAPARPLEWWRAGQFLRYRSQLVIPRSAAGPYTVWAGLWRGAQRMPARSAKVRVEQDRAAVMSFEVAP
jgi:choline-sulfatase